MLGAVSSRGELRKYRLSTTWPTCTAKLNKYYSNWIRLEFLCLLYFVFAYVSNHISRLGADSAALTGLSRDTSYCMLNLNALFNAALVTRLSGLVFCCACQRRDSLVLTGLPNQCDPSKPTNLSDATYVDTPGYAQNGGRHY